jgi:hypothetical protein
VGRPLPEKLWERRHRGILVLLWLHVLGLAWRAGMNGYLAKPMRAQDLAEAMARLVPSADDMTLAVGTAPLHRPRAFREVEGGGGPDH